MFSEQVRTWDSFDSLTRLCVYIWDRKMPLVKNQGASAAISIYDILSLHLDEQKFDEFYS